MDNKELKNQDLEKVRGGADIDPEVLDRLKKEGACEIKVNILTPTVAGIEGEKLIR